MVTEHSDNHCETWTLEPARARDLKGLTMTTAADGASLYNSVINID